MNKKAIVGSIGCKVSMKSEIKEKSFHSKCKFWWNLKKRKEIKEKGGE